MKTPIPSFEIPPDMRAMAEKSVEQARNAFNTYMTAAQSAAEGLEGRSKAAQAGAKDMTVKAMTYAEQNVAAAFAFAQKMVHAKDLQELVAMQNEFAQNQMKALTEQAKDLGQIVTDTVTSAAKPKA